MQTREARILTIGDMHFSARSLPLLELLKPKILEMIVKYKPDHAVFLGDTHDRFGNINSTRSKEVVLFFYQVALLVPFTLLIGNHDIPNKMFMYCEDHDFTAMKFFWQNTTIVDSYHKFSVNGFSFGAVAYCPNGRLLEGLEPLQPLGDLTAVFCHQEIHGCSINGLTSVEGDKWEIINPPLFCGHIHEYQRPQPNVCYIGTPYQDSFGEGTDKSISLLTFREGEPWSEERIYLDLPKKFRLHMTGAEFMTWAPISPNLYSLTVTGSQKECEKIREMPLYKKMKIEGNKIELAHTSKKVELREGDTIRRERRQLRDVVAANIENKEYLHNLHSRVFSM